MEDLFCKTTVVVKIENLLRGLNKVKETIGKWSNIYKKSVMADQ